MTASELVMRQMERLDNMSTDLKDPETACRVAETIGLLGSLVIRAGGAAGEGFESEVEGVEPLVGVKELSKITGISEYAIRNTVGTDPDFPALRINGRLLFHVSAVRDWIDMREKERKAAAGARKAKAPNLYQVK